MSKRLRKSIAPPSIEKRAAVLAGKHITYTLKRSSRRRRSIGLSVDDRGLIVSVPLRASEKWLHSVLQDKADWVVEKLDGWQTCQPQAYRWQDGETIDYLGELLVLRVVQGLFATPVQRLGRELWVFVVNGSEETVEYTVTNWYRVEAEQFFKQRAAHYAPLLNVRPRTVKLSEAKTLLGRDYQVEGTVVKGHQRGGRLLGFPTANLKPEDELLPKTGVYAVTVMIDDRAYQGVTNVGYNPTFHDKSLTVETHVLDYSGDLVGKNIRINFLSRLRGERSFQDIRELSEQIARDIEDARTVFAASPKA